jgi:ADP-ribose pyrophosphatase
MEPWKTLSKDLILDCGKYLKVEKHSVELSDGRIIDDWPWVIIPDYANVVALTMDKKFICFRQVKYAVEGTSLAIVGGLIEPNESPLEAAKRELLEETGYEAGRWISLGEYSVDANRGAGKGNFYLAIYAAKVTEPNSDDLEEQELLLLSRNEILDALRNGEFKVLSWSANVALALVHLETFK